ncbi:MAG: TA system VapC family ribonuclease toxin [Panacagrimonas sp.]
MVAGIVLLDVNVIVAIAWSEHVHHAPARRWLLGRKGKRWASCPFTECGFLRITANAKRTGAIADLAEAVESLRSLRNFVGHQFWTDDLSPVEAPLFAHLRGHRQVTDAYLLMLAARNGGRLATFDRGIKTMAADLLGDPDRVELISDDPVA